MQSDTKSKAPGFPGGDDDAIKVTPAMAEAGAEILAFYERGDGLTKTAEQIYRAMLEARPG